MLWLLLKMWLDSILLWLLLHRWNLTVRASTLRLLLRRLTVHVRDSVGVRRSALTRVVMAFETARMTVLASGGLRDVRYNLHATRDDTSWPAAAGRIRRCRGASKALRELLDQSLSHVISGDVNCVGDTQDDQRPFRR